MPHDKVKAAARKRMAETGEKYATARRAVIEEQARRESEQAAERDEAPDPMRPVP